MEKILVNKALSVVGFFAILVAIAVLLFGTVI
jgi:hypothetical protein